MNIPIKSILSFTFLISSFFTNIAFAQTIILPPDYIKSVQLIASGNDYFVPVVSLGQRITLSFDDLEADQKDYYYLLEHCDKNWNTSQIISTDFVRGYQKEQFRDYRNSFNTLQEYTHYSISFPNEQTRVIISGNYRISVLNDNDDVIFTRYFAVYEPLTTVGVSVHRSRDVNFFGLQQSVQFVVNHKGLMINNPQQEIYPVIYQNFDFNTAISGLQPQFIKPDQLWYKYDKETAFWGGNEFLYFDNKDILNQNMTVAQVLSGKNLYETILFQDLPRKYDPYTYYPDANGNFVVRNIKGDDADSEADYSYVNFTLKYPEQLDKKIYVYGKFNDNQLTDENLMKFDEKSQSYVAKIKLKQGFYNYNYILLNPDNTIDTTVVNGSFDQTENDYQVLIYYSKFGSKYDRLIGYGVGSSKELQQ